MEVCVFFRLPLLCADIFIAVMHDERFVIASIFSCQGGP
jgi:hypothetical protein